MSKDHQIKDSVTSPIYSLGEDRSRIMVVAFVLGLIGIGAAFALSFTSGINLRRFSFAYLTNFCFFASISIGAIFFVMSQHLTKAGWSVTLRRIGEMLGMTILVMALLFVPIAFFVGAGFEFPYVWNSDSWFSPVSDTDYAALSKDEQSLYDIHGKKAMFLNSGFFIIRNIAYFVIWIGIAVFLYRNSLRQDTTKAKGLTSRLQALCAPLMILFVLAMVFATFDWEMSLAPMWFSTMFPVYFFAGAVLSAMATITLIALLLQRSGRITDEVTVDNYHDMCKLCLPSSCFGDISPSASSC